MGVASDWLSKHPVTQVSVVSYLVLMSLNPISRFLRGGIGEAADVLMMTAFLWPYPLALSLQKGLIYLTPSALSGRIRA